MATKEAQREYMRRWIAKRRFDFFSDKNCIQCGSVENLELDHIDPRTKVSHSIWSWSESRRLAEIAKCQVLCQTCHKQKTRDQYPITNGFAVHQHGTINMYESQKCKCEPCRAAKHVRTKGSGIIMPALRRMSRIQITSLTLSRSSENKNRRMSK